MMGLHIWRKVCFASSQNNQITKNDWTLLVCMDQHGPEGRRDGFYDIGLEMVWEGQREARNPRPLLRSCALGFFPAVKFYFSTVPFIFSRLLFYLSPVLFRFSDVRAWVYFQVSSQVSNLDTPRSQPSQLAPVTSLGRSVAGCGQKNA